MCLLKKINKIANSDLILKIDNIKIIPRKDDLPEHYIKGDSEKEKNDRMNVIINIQRNFYHNHLVCSEKIYIYKNRNKIVIDYGCKKARYILKQKQNSNDLEFFLISAFKLRNRQLKKIEEIEEKTEIINIDDLVCFLNMYK